MIKSNNFYSADHLLKSSLSLFHTAQILHLIRHRKHAVSRAKILCYSYQMHKHLLSVFIESTINVVEPYPFLCYNKRKHSGGFSMIREICNDGYFLSQKAE